MNTATPSDITSMLHELRQGKHQVLHKLLPIVYSELRRLAAYYLRQEPRKATMQTTDLVHEAFLKLTSGEEVPWQNRAHFFAVAAQAMRQILVDHARKRKAAKRGGGREKITLKESLVVSEDNSQDLLALDQALDKLKSFDERLGQIVEMRFFAGLTIEETAAVLNVSRTTVKRDWDVAEAWLGREYSSCTVVAWCVTPSVVGAFGLSENVRTPSWLVSRSSISQLLCPSRSHQEG